MASIREADGTLELSRKYVTRQGMMWERSKAVSVRAQDSPAFQLIEVPVGDEQLPHARA